MTSRSVRPVSVLGAVLLSAAVLAACSSGSGHRSGEASSVPSAAGVPVSTSTTEPAPSFAPSPFAWERSNSPALATGGGAGATLAAVLAPQSTQSWTIAGTRFAADGTPRPALWTSRDGVTWSATQLAPGGGAGQVHDAAQYRGETVVVGSVGRGPERQAAAWISPSPGAAFRPMTVLGSSGVSSMSLVTAGRVGLFATGNVDGRFALWSSTDGHSWSEVPQAERAIGDTPGAQVHALLAENDVVFAAGSVQNGANEAAALWSTGDGTHWSLVRTATDNFAGTGDRVIYSLAPLATGLVAVGAVNYGTGWVPASWVSPDGASWSPPSTDFPGLAGASPGLYGPSGGAAARSVSAVTTLAGEDSVVAAGGGGLGAGNQQAWASTDGLHWTALPLPARAGAATGWRATLVAGTSTTTLVLDGDPGQAHLLVDGPVGSSGAPAWSEPSANPATFGPVRPVARPVALDRDTSKGGLLLEVQLDSSPQAVGTLAVSTELLESTNGTSWSAAAAGTVSAQSPGSLPAPDALVLQEPTGWVAAASKPRGRSEVWTSQDGRSWTPAGYLGVPPTASSSTVQGLCQVTTDGTAQGVAAVGTDTTTTAAQGESPQWSGPGGIGWASSTGATWHRVPVTPAPPVDSLESMSGCTTAGNETVAYGSGGGPGGTPVPALWRSSGRSGWARMAVTGFTPAAAGPLTDLSVAGKYWLAIANSDPAAGPFPLIAPDTGSGSTATSRLSSGPAAAAVTDGAVAPDTAGVGAEPLWLSSDAGGTWQPLDTSSPPWQGDQQAEVDLVAFAGSMPVFAGTLDGELAVWTGTLVGGSSSSGRSAS